MYGVNLGYNYDIRFSLDILKYKTEADIKEGIRLGVFPIFNFNTSYELSPPSWEVVVNSMYSLWKFCRYKQLCIPGVVHRLLPALTYPQWYTSLPLVHLLCGNYQGFPSTVTRSEVLTW